jgi:hypothetical protein
MLALMLSSDWAESLTATSMDGGVAVAQGALRTCDLKSFGPVAAGKIQEELTEYDSEKMALTYLVLSGVPGFMRRVTNAWVITPIDENRYTVYTI